MNVSDLYKFSLGQYGSVSLKSNEQLSLLGSSKYLIGAIQILSNREVTSADNSFKWLVSNEGTPLYWGTHFGASRVLQFNGPNVSSANDTIKVNNSLDWQHIRVGHSCNYWKRGQTDSSFGLGSASIGSATSPIGPPYWVVEKNERDRTVKLGLVPGGPPINLTTQSDSLSSGDNLRALAFPAITSITTNKVIDELDADGANHDATAFSDGENIIEGSVLYGRWNFIRMGAHVRAVAYLIPKII